MDLSTYVAQGMTVPEICEAVAKCERTVTVLLRRQGLMALARENRSRLAHAA